MVKDYSLTATDDQGPDRLLVEMSAGQVPDIIDLGGSLPFHQMVKKGYLEDLRSRRPGYRLPLSQGTAS